MVRIKDSEVKKKSSYDLTPDSPKPDTDWRDEKSGSKLNPLVDATDHKKNHKTGGGILSWIKSLTASPQPKKTIKKKSTQKRRPRKGNYKKKNANSSNLDQAENLLHLRIQEDLQHLRVQEDLQSLLIGSQKMTLEQKIREKKLHQEILG